MGRGLRFSLAGIPVQVDLSFLAVIGLLALVLPPRLVAVWSAVIVASVMLHEVGHAVAFRYFGSHASIRLHALGGMTTGARLEPRASIVVSLAGPLSGLLLLGLPALLIGDAAAGLDPLWREAVNITIYVNVLWSALNLLPVLPLDGGNVTQSLIQLATGDESSRTAHQVSIAVSGALGVASILLAFPLGVLAAGALVGVNWSLMRQSRQREHSLMVARGQRALLAGDAETALMAASAVRATSPDQRARTEAAELEAWSWLVVGDPRQATEVIEGLGEGVRVSSVLEGAIALANDERDLGLSLLAYGFVKEPPGPSQLFAALVAARGGHIWDLVAELAIMEDVRGHDVAEMLPSLLIHAGSHAGAREAEAALASLRQLDPRPLT